MKRIKTEEILKLSEEEQIKRLNDLRTELAKLHSGAARGTLKKELGEIKSVRRNVARVMTAINEKRRQEREASIVATSQGKGSKQRSSA